MQGAAFVRAGREQPALAGRPLSKRYESLPPCTERHRAPWSLRVLSVSRVVRIEEVAAEPSVTSARPGQRDRRGAGAFRDALPRLGARQRWHWAPCPARRPRADGAPMGMGCFSCGDRAGCPDHSGSRQNLDGEADHHGGRLHRHLLVQHLEDPWIEFLDRLRICLRPEHVEVAEQHGRTADHVGF